MTTATIDLGGRQSCQAGEAVEDLEEVFPAPSFHLVASYVDVGFWHPKSWMLFHPPGKYSVATWQTSNHLTVIPLLVHVRRLAVPSPRRCS